MEWAEVESRVAAGEGEHTEFKRDLVPDAVARAICAFANTDGGIVVLGVTDDGQAKGIADDPDELQERITTLLQTALSAPVHARIGRHPVSGGYVHWIEVARNRGEPRRVHGRFFVRRARSSVEPSGAELQDLFNTFGFVLTEEQVVPGSGPRDLDAEAFREFLRAQGIDTDDQPQPDAVDDYLNRGVLGREFGEPRATVYGLLCFGRQPQTLQPLRNAWVELVAYAGTDRSTATLLRGEAKGRADEQVERAVGWLQGLGTRETSEGIHRVDRPLVPLRAVREGIVNAVAHRDYAVLGSRTLVEVFSDRLDITSPGELPNHMTEAAALAGAHPRSRNEAMAHFLVVRRLAEQRGRGLPTVRREMRAFNGTEPALRSDRDGRYVRLTLRL